MMPPSPARPNSQLPAPQDIVAGKKLRMVGIVGIYAANTVGDDIEVYIDESRAEVGPSTEGWDETGHSSSGWVAGWQQGGLKE